MHIQETLMMRKTLNLLEIPAHRLLFHLTSPRTATLLGEPLFDLTSIRREKISSLSQVKHVLVVRLDEIGDVVLTTPFLRELRRNLPNAWITLVVNPQVYNLVELCPYVNEVLTYDWDATGRWPETRQLRRHTRALRLGWKRLWHRRFDLAIVPRWDADYYHASFVSYFSGAPWRVGFSENVISHKQKINNGYDSLFTHTLCNNTLKHEVEHNLDIIHFLGGKPQDDRLELWLSEEDEAIAKQFLNDQGLKANDPLIGLAPGAGAPKRMWPIDRFAQLGLWLQKTYEARFVVVGGPGEESLGEELKQVLGISVINAIGKTTLRQTAALLKHCKLFVGNDAGPMHIAAAVGTPVIEISCHPMNGEPSHPNSPKRFGPWRVSHTILQPPKALSPCSNACEADQAHCILSISLERVQKAIAKHLSQGQLHPKASKQKTLSQR